MQIYKHHPIKNSLKVKSFTKFYIEIDNSDDFNKLNNFIMKHKLPVIILGEGTNIIPPSQFHGIVVKPIFNNIEVNKKINSISVGSSINWHELVKKMVELDIYGFENLSLIPGTVGAAPIQNIGAYGQEISNLINEVHCYDYIEGSFVKLSNSDCKFSYRKSSLQYRNLLIYKVVFKTDAPHVLNLNYKSIQDYIDDNELDKSNIDLNTISKIICKIRNKNLPDPKEIPNVGSFFKNPIINIEDINLKAFSLNDLIIWKINDKTIKVGAARLIDLIKNKINEDKNISIYKNHSLVLTTNAKSNQEEVLRFANQIQVLVFDTFNIQLEIEPTVITN
tara:strand:- start:53 stop:1057 length:1005 start_codon:yes stop_codon:yes gene_type:complete